MIPVSGALSVSVAADVEERPASSKPRQVPGKVKQGAAVGKDGLSPRERQFIGAMCLNGFRQTEACKTLGYGGNRPEVEASRLMRRPAIKAEIERRQLAMETKAEVTIERIVAQYAKLAFAQHDGPLTASHVLTALEALGRHKGAFKQDQATVIPITFQFIGGPPLAGDVLTVEQASQPAPATDAPLLGKPERG